VGLIGRLDAWEAKVGGRLSKFTRRVYEAGKFGAVGAAAWVVDNGVFLLATQGPGQVMGAMPVRASIVAGLVATGFSYIGNRYWTFSGKRAKLPTKEVVAFVVANIVGIIITNACLYLSRWVFDFHGAGPDTIARNIGIVLGTIFRYLAYKFWVFNAKTTETP
jgi:putative flippase GtrA